MQKAQEKALNITKAKLTTHSLKAKVPVYPTPPMAPPKTWLHSLEASVTHATPWTGPVEASNDLSATHAMGWILASVFFLILLVNSLKARKVARGSVRAGERDTLIYRPPRSF